MKSHFLIIVLPFILQFCSMRGFNWIYSPKTDKGVLMKYNGPHEGARKKAPYDAVIFPLYNDSTLILAYAQELSSKLTFGEILYLPIIPFFWLPNKPFYKDDPNHINIYLEINSNHEVEVIPDSITIHYDEKIANITKFSDDEEGSLFSYFYEGYNPEYYKKITRPLFNQHKTKVIILQFPLPIENTEKFSLEKLQVKINGKPILLPTIKFQKMKQGWYRSAFH